VSRDIRQESTFRSLKRQVKRLFRKKRSTVDVFTHLHDGNRWHGVDSVSGPGSDAEETRTLLQKLPSLLRKYEVRSLLDAPCGDLFWISNMDLEGIQYTGIDIVPALIEENRRRYASTQFEFQCADLMRDQLPSADLILCRDCLVHFSYDDVAVAIKNMQSSRSKWLLTTTFIDQEENRDIATGEWRAINLQRPPFSFPEPLELLDEECPHEDGAYRDKMLGLWRLSDLQTEREINPGSSR